MIKIIEKLTLNISICNKYMYSHDLWNVKTHLLKFVIC